MSSILSGVGSADRLINSCAAHEIVLRLRARERVSDTDPTTRAVFAAISDISRLPVCRYARWNGPAAGRHQVANRFCSTSSEIAIARSFSMSGRGTPIDSSSSVTATMRLCEVVLRVRFGQEDEAHRPNAHGHRALGLAIVIAAGSQRPQLVRAAVRIGFAFCVSPISRARTESRADVPSATHGCGTGRHIRRSPRRVRPHKDRAGHCGICGRERLSGSPS